MSRAANTALRSLESVWEGSPCRLLEDIICRPWHSGHDTTVGFQHHARDDTSSFQRAVERVDPFPSRHQVSSPILVLATVACFFGAASRVSIFSSIHTHAAVVGMLQATQKTSSHRSNTWHECTPLVVTTITVTVAKEKRPHRHLKHASFCGRKVGKCVFVSLFSIATFNGAAGVHDAGSHLKPNRDVGEGKPRVDEHTIIITKEMNDNTHGKD